MDRFQIRDAVADDAEKVAVLHVAAWSEAIAPSYVYPPLPQATQRWRDLLDRATSRALLGEEDGKSVGYLTAMSTPNICEITDIFVATGYRRLGIATMMLSRLIQTTCSPPVMTLWVAETNEAAIELYRRFDFQETGEIKLEPRRIDSARMRAMRRQLPLPTPK